MHYTWVVITHAKSIDDTGGEPSEVLQSAWYYVITINDNIIIPVWSRLLVESSNCVQQFMYHNRFL